MRMEAKMFHNTELFQGLKQHVEMIAAIVSGVLIFFAWLLSIDDFNIISTILFIFAFVIGGFAKAKEGIEETIREGKLNVELLMVFAAIGSAIIGHWLEGAILIFIFALSGALETYTMNKTNKEISSLMELQPEEALLLVDGREEKVHVSTLSIGDLIIVKPGDRIPVDGQLINGHTTVDESAITGESIPVEKDPGSEVYAGTVNVNGSITVRVTKKASETLFQKIIELVQNAQSEKSPSQQFIEKFEGTYVKGVLIAVAVLMFAPPFLLGWSFQESFYRSMVFMVVASPCALVASIMPATLSAISNGARNGILFKGGVHLERLNKIRAIAFDKTGTLTKGEPIVTDVIVRPDVEKTELLQAVYNIERQSSHPLAKAITAYIQENVKGLKDEWVSVDEHSGFGVSASWNGQKIFVGKAAFVGKEEAEQFQNSVSKKLYKQGKTVVYVKDEKGIAASIALKDVLRPDMKNLMDELKSKGIYTVMLTGDTKASAEAIAKEASVDEFHGECLPESKVDRIKQLNKQFGVTAMIGDGINDAPALKTASVGIAMGEGTDVALETADVVLMKNDLTKLIKAIELSQKMNKIVKQNIAFSLSVIALLICANFLQVIDLPFGVIGHEGSTILVILNGLRLLRS